MKNAVARRKFLVKQNVCRDRLKFAHEHLNWPAEQWSSVVFTDKTKGNLRGSDGRVYFCRRLGEEFNPKFISRQLSMEEDQ